MDKKWIVVDKNGDTSGVHNTKEEAMETAADGLEDYGPCIIGVVVPVLRIFKPVEPYTVETIGEECPDVKIVASQVANYVREPAIKFMEDTLQRFKDGEIQLVYAHNDDMALGAVTALEAANRQKGVMVVGIDGENAAYDAIKAGKMVATFTYHFVAPEGIQYGYKVAKGEAVDEEIILPTHQVDAANVDQFLGKGF